MISVQFPNLEFVMQPSSLACTVLHCVLEVLELDADYIIE